jgi:hypothetical protein
MLRHMQMLPGRGMMPTAAATCSWLNVTWASLSTPVVALAATVSPKDSWVKVKE